MCKVHKGPLRFIKYDSARLSTCPCGQRMVKRYPIASVLSFGFFSNCFEKQPSGRFYLKLFWLTFALWLGAHACFNLRVKVSCYAFSNCLGFAKFLPGISPWFCIFVLDENSCLKALKAGMVHMTENKGNPVIWMKGFWVNIMRC